MSDEGDKLGVLIDVSAVPPQHALRGYGLGAFTFLVPSEHDADEAPFAEESPAGAESSIMISAGSPPSFIPHDALMRRTYITSCAGERGAPRYVSICICSHHAFECTCQKLHLRRPAARVLHLFSSVISCRHEQAPRRFEHPAFCVNRESLAQS